jgi:hypothetical protein
MFCRFDAKMASEGLLSQMERRDSFSLIPLKAEGALGFECRKRQRLCVTRLKDSSSVCDIETLVFRCLLEKHFFLPADDLECC